ncbi:MAG TPA: ABC transporter substrate-binding protein [Thermoleophilaceae bacterium]
MRKHLGSRKTRSVLSLLILAVGLSIVVSACGSSNKSSTTSGGGGGGGGSSTSSQAADVTKCGTKPGVKATGTPIKLGAIVTKQPGTDFTDGATMADAYFHCVNDNGGINGHPIQYKWYEEQTNPAQIAGFAHKLIQTDKVVGVVGGFSIIECAVDHKYWESLGIYELDAGIAPECWGTSNSAPPNMGPRYSSDGAVQGVVRAGAKKIAFDQSNVPGTGYIAAGPASVAKALNVPIQQFKDNVPIQDANSIALKLVQAAGSDGGVVLNFTPPEALKILQAAQQQNLQDRVKAWACSTPCNTDFVAKALGQQWDGKLLVNAELNVTDNNGPQTRLYRAVFDKYGSKVSGGLGSFSQMGFVMAQQTVMALESIKGGTYNIKTVNQAIKNLKGFKTDMLCKPWYYGQAPLHIPNNTDYTTTPHNGKMVIKDGCIPINAADPGIAQVRAIEKKDPSLSQPGTPVPGA